MRIRRCLPLRGKGASELARLILVCRGRELFAGRFAHQERLAGAPGERKHAVLRSMRPPRLRNHPAGRTAGSARTRSRDPYLENPFLGERQPFSRGSTPPKRRRRQAPARGLAAVYPCHRPKRTETQQPRPIRDGAGLRQHGAEGAGSRHCRGTAARRRLRAFWQVSVRIQSRSPRSIRRSACTPSGPAMPT